MAEETKKRTRRKFSSTIKAKRVAEAEETSIAEVCRKYKIARSVIHNWMQEFNFRTKKKTPVASHRDHVRVVPYGNEDGTYLITIGSKTYLGKEVALMPVQRR